MCGSKMVEAKDEPLEIIGVTEVIEKKAPHVCHENNLDARKRNLDLLQDDVFPRDRTTAIDDLAIDSDTETDPSDLDISSCSKSFTSESDESCQEASSVDIQELPDSVTALSLQDDSERIEDLKLFMNDFRSLGTALKDKWLEEEKFQRYYQESFQKLRKGDIMEISGAEILLTTSMKEDYESFVRALVKKCLSKCIVASFDDGFAFEFEAAGENDVRVRSNYGRQTGCVRPAQDWSFYVREGIQLMDLESIENIFNFLEEWKIFVSENSDIDMKGLMARGIFSF